MAVLKLALVAAVEEWKQRQALAAPLELALVWLAGTWQLVEPADADVLVISLRDGEPSQTLWEEWCRVFPLDRIVVHGTGHCAPEARQRFPVSHRGVPTALSIVSVLLGLEKNLRGTSLAEESHRPEAYIQGVIEEARADGISRVCTLAADPKISLYLMPKENACYILDDIEQAIPMCAAQRGELRVETIADHELLRKTGYVTFSARLSKYASALGADLFEEIKFKKAKRYPLKELIWFATLVNARGRLLEGCRPDAPVLVKHAPEFIRLPYYQDYLHTAKLMGTQAQTLPETAAQTALPIAQIVGFHNACTLLGLAMRGDEALREARRHMAARERLHSLLRPYAHTRGNRLKIVVAGTVGSGKTTLVSTLSDFSPVTTETRPSDAVAQRKSSTTVAMDYGEARFTDMKLFLYGTPGQKRFEFMGEILCNTAWALLIMIDNTETDPLAELDYYLRLYRTVLPRLKVVLGITHCDEAAGGPDLAVYRAQLARQGFHYPVARLDPRDYADAVRFLAETLEAPAIDQHLKTA